MSEQPTSQELRTRLADLEQRIEGKCAELKELQDALPALVLQSTGRELGAARERKRIAELDDEVKALRIGANALQQSIADAEQREQGAEFNARLAEAQRRAGELHSKAADLQQLLSRVVAFIGEIRDVDEAFCAALPGANPSGFDRLAFTNGLMRRIELALYVYSNGALRPRGVFENAHEMRESGKADLKRAATDYTTVALRGRRAPRIDIEPPEAA